MTHAEHTNELIHGWADYIERVSGINPLTGDTVRRVHSGLTVVTPREPYTPLLEQPLVNGDSLHTPFVVGRVVDLGGVSQHQLNSAGLPHFVAKNDLSERATGAANEGAHSEVAAPLKKDTLAMREPYDKYVRFVPVAEVFAGMSKMPGTNVGCVVLGDAMQVLASGWNGAARGCNADCDHRLETRELRLTWVVHAEVNAIANAARTGVSLEGGVLICTLMPCMACAKLIVQSGIALVLCPAPTPADARWQAEFDLTRALFTECGVHIHHYNPENQ